MQPNIVPDNINESDLSVEETNLINKSMILLFNDARTMHPDDSDLLVIQYYKCFIIKLYN